MDRIICLLWVIHFFIQNWKSSSSCGLPNFLIHYWSYWFVIITDIFIDNIFYANWVYLSLSKTILLYFIRVCEVKNMYFQAFLKLKSKSENCMMWWKVMFQLNLLVSTVTATSQATPIKEASINYVDKQGGELAKCQR